MTTLEIKKDVHEKVEQLSDNELAKVQQFIDSINSYSSIENELLNHAQNIVEERKVVLEKLAQ